MTRRGFLMAAAAAGALRADTRQAMGIAVTSYLSFARPKDTYEFLEHAHALGAGGIQMGLSSTEPEYTRKLRARAAELGMYVEAMASLPAAGAEEAFERSVAAAVDTGALCIRTACLSGRRYETFGSLAEWQKFVSDSRQAIDRALPIAEKHGIPLALENHKDWTADELAVLMKEHASRWLGVCLDTGNNISLLDDPMEVVETLAPYTIATHIKDMGVAQYDEGFLLSELPMGDGMLDMARTVATIRRARPETRMTLEMITRDPLRVPCLTERYWATFPDRSGRYLARALRMAREWKGHAPLPLVSGLDREAQLRVEEDNVKRCLEYARAKLGL